MSYKKVGSAKNYGYGRSPIYAARCALQDRYGKGRYGTRRTMAARIGRFIAFMIGNQVREFEGVSIDEDSVTLGRVLQRRSVGNDQRGSLPHSERTEFVI